jgi:hypothetical protein
MVLTNQRLEHLGANTILIEFIGFIVSFLLFSFFCQLSLGVLALNKTDSNLAHLSVEALGTTFSWVVENIISHRAILFLVLRDTKQNLNNRVQITCVAKVLHASVHGSKHRYQSLSSLKHL